MKRIQKILTTAVLSSMTVAGFAADLPDRTMAGYIDLAATGSAAAITPEQLEAYNVVVMSFAEADGSLSETNIEMMNKIRDIEKTGTINLLSYGGEHGHTIDLSDPETVKRVALELNKSVEENGLDGIDLDIEDPSVTSEQVTMLGEEIKKDSSDTILVAAPILAGDASAPTLNIPMGGSSISDSFRDGTVFDAVFVQAYNSGLGFKYADPATGDLIPENDPNIVRTAYDSLHTKGNLSSDLKVVIGIPSNPGGAPTESNLWLKHNPDHNRTSSLILDNTKNIESGEYGIDSSSFGGLMTWSINTDAMPSAYPSPYGTNPEPGFFAKNVAKPYLDQQPPIEEGLVFVNEPEISDITERSATASWSAQILSDDNAKARITYEYELKLEYQVFNSYC